MSEKTQTYQVGGNHYSRHKIQPWDIIGEYGLDFWEGNALECLLLRDPNVPRAEQLKKARACLDYLIRREENRAANELLARQSIALAREALKRHRERDPDHTEHHWAHQAEGQV